MKILVTGHHGYLGSVMVPILTDAGHEVVGMDTFFYRGCDFGEGSLPVVARVEDVRDIDRRMLDGFEAIVHLAALSNDPVGDLNPHLTAEINHEATLMLARAAKAAGAARFVFASSCSMYGAGSGDALVDEQAPLRPLTPYAQAKVHAEEALRELADENFAPVFMRNATVFGVSPRLRLDVVLNNLVAWAHTTGSIRMQSDGTPWRPLVHVTDVARATRALVEAPMDDVRNEAFNIGASSENHQIRDLAALVQARLPSCDVDFAGASPDSRSYRVDFTKFATAFPGCRLGVTAAHGVDELVEAYERVGLTLDDFKSRRYIRLGQIKHLLTAQLLDDDLRWSSLGA